MWTPLVTTSISCTKSLAIASQTLLEKQGVSPDIKNGNTGIFAKHQKCEDQMGWSQTRVWYLLHRWQVNIYASVTLNITCGLISFFGGGGVGERGFLFSNSIFNFVMNKQRECTRYIHYFNITTIIMWKLHACQKNRCNSCPSKCNWK